MGDGIEKHFLGFTKEKFEPDGTQCRFCKEEASWMVGGFKWHGMGFASAPLCSQCTLCIQNGEDPAPDKDSE